MFGFSFVNPLFLYALAGLAAPIIIHLLFKARRRVFPFSSIRFILQSAVLKSSRLRLRELLLLLLRLAVFALLVLAFSQPYKHGGRKAGTLGGASRDVLLLIDNAFPMGAEVGDEALLDLARSAARRELGRLRSGDRVSLCTTSGGDRLLLRWTGKLTTAERLVDEIKLTGEEVPYAKAVARASVLFADSDAPIRELVLICAAQSSRWSAVTADLPEGIGFRTVAVGPDDAANVAVTGMQPNFKESAAGGRVAMSVEVSNFSSAAADLLLQAFSADKLIHKQQLKLRARERREIPLSLEDVSARWASVKISGRDREALLADNARCYSLSGIQPVKLLCVEEFLPQTQSEQETYFLRMALEPDPKRPGKGLLYTVEGKEPAELAASNLSDYSLLVLSNLRGLTPAQVGCVEDYVKSGGSVVVFLGPLANASIYNANMHRDGNGFLPLALAEKRQLAGGLDIRYIADFEEKHPVFEAFQQTAKASLSIPEFSAWYALIPPAGQAAASVLARFDNGDLAVAERSFGEGKVLQFAFPCDLTWSDLPKRVAFVPLQHGVCSYLVEREAASATGILCGEAMVIDTASFGWPTARRQSISSVRVTDPAGRSTLLKLDENDRCNAGPVYVSGLYRIDPCDADGNAVADVPPARLSVHLSARGSDLRRMSEEELASAEREPRVLAAKGASAGSGDSSGEAAGGPWRSLLVVALALLCAEIVLANKVRL